METKPCEFIFGEKHKEFKLLQDEEWTVHSLERARIELEAAIEFLISKAKGQKITKYEV